MKKWLGLLQTASQLEFSFQGLCRQVMHEQVQYLFANATPENPVPPLLVTVLLQHGYEPCKMSANVKTVI